MPKKEMTPTWGNKSGTWTCKKELHLNVSQMAHMPKCIHILIYDSVGKKDNLKKHFHFNKILIKISVQNKKSL